MDENLEKLKEVASELLDDCPAHNIDHVMRVFNMAMILASSEDVDQEVVAAAALLHDIGGRRELEDLTGSTDHAVVGAEMAEPILKELGYSPKKIKHIQDCIITHRHRTSNKPQTIEAQIVHDADRLETVGAIGAARICAWVGTNNAKLYKRISVEEYAKENLVGRQPNGRILDPKKHSPQMAYLTKDRYIIDNVYTKKAKEIAAERLSFLEQFHDRMEKEIKGEL